jgi:hypothetical protein
MQTMEIGCTVGDQVESLRAVLARAASPVG